jgi:hypothetical protein
MTEHRWSGWPGAWCLDCGAEDPREIALADGNYVEVKDDVSPMGFHFEFPNIDLECKEPGSNRHNPYVNNRKTYEETILEKYSTQGLKKNNVEE